MNGIPQKKNQQLMRVHFPTRWHSEEIAWTSNVAVGVVIDLLAFVHVDEHVVVEKAANRGRTGYEVSDLETLAIVNCSP